MQTLRASVSKDGATLSFIYCDDLRELLDEGSASIARASHVEPYGLDWAADMSPVGGGVLGPYSTRQEALAAEVEWLHRHIIN